MNIKDLSIFKKRNEITVQVNCEQSEKLQTLVFKLGFKWAATSEVEDMTRVRHLNYRFINLEHNGKITASDFDPENSTAIAYQTVIDCLQSALKHPTLAKTVTSLPLKFKVAFTSYENKLEAIEILECWGYEWKHLAGEGTGFKDAFKQKHTTFNNIIVNAPKKLVQGDSTGLQHSWLDYTLVTESDFLLLCNLIKPISVEQEDAKEKPENSNIDNPAGISLPIKVLTDLTLIDAEELSKIVNKLFGRNTRPAFFTKGSYQHGFTISEECYINSLSPAEFMKCACRPVEISYLITVYDALLRKEGSLDFVKHHIKEDSVDEPFNIVSFNILKHEDSEDFDPFVNQIMKGSPLSRGKGILESTQLVSSQPSFDKLYDMYGNRLVNLEGPYAFKFNLKRPMSYKRIEYRLEESGFDVVHLTSYCGVHRLTSPLWDLTSPEFTVTDSNIKHVINYINNYNSKNKQHHERTTSKNKRKDKTIILPTKATTAKFGEKL